MQILIIIMNIVIISDDITHHIESIVVHLPKDDDNLSLPEGQLRLSVRIRRQLLWVVVKQRPHPLASCIGCDIKLAVDGATKQMN